ncbi:19400_t:CDS:2, partial [Gigaspora rosea]
MSATKKTQPKKNSGGKQRHFLTEFIITTDEYVNPEKPYDKYCYCQPFGGEEQAKNILNSEEQPTKKLRLDCQEVVAVKTKTKIDSFLARVPMVSEQAQFENQILDITISNGWSFKW